MTLTSKSIWVACSWSQCLRGSWWIKLQKYIAKWKTYNQSNIKNKNKGRPVIITKSFPENGKLLNRIKIAPGNQSYNDVVKKGIEAYNFGTSLTLKRVGGSQFDFPCGFFKNCFYDESSRERVKPWCLGLLILS